MNPKNPDYEAQTRALFAKAPFIQWTGMRVTHLEPGEVHTEMVLKTDHNQQDGFVHAGMQATIADHTAGAAAGTLIGADEVVLSAEFKINLLRPAKGVRLICEARILKPGRSLTVVESYVYAENAAKLRKLVSKATVTLAVVSAKGLSAGERA